MEEKQNGHSDHEMKGGGMGKRGVTRPMAQMQMQHHEGMEDDGEQQHEKGRDHSMMMSDEMREKMLHTHHMQTLWVYWALVILGIWMVLAPFTFDYGRAVAEPSGGREVWLSLEQRIAFMK